MPRLAGTVHRRRRGVRLGLAAVVVGVVGVVGVTGLAPASASLGSPPGGVSFGLTPVPTAAGQPRPYFNLTIEPGGSAQDIAIVSNEGSRTERLRVGTSRGITAANSGSAFGSFSRTCTGVGCWVTGLPATVTLVPGTGRAIGFRVAVPAGTRPGQYLAGITVVAAAPPHSVQLRSHGHVSVNVIVVDQVTVGVAITVGSLARLRTRLVVPTVTAGSIGSLPRLYVHVRNTGQTFARASGTVSCRVAGQDRRFRVIIDTVLPGGQAVLPINAPGLGSGEFPCTVSLRDDAGHTVTWSGTVGAIAPTPAKTIHTGNGAYSTLPDNGVPAWAIALMVLGGLILAALVGVLVLYRRASRRSEPRG
ncbi:MAG: hypothetical protein ACRDOU_22600 [Streptosporangiaceae bacterium]